MDFMERQVRAGKPFYVQISHYAGDGGADARPQTYTSVRRRAKAGDEKLVDAAGAVASFNAVVKVADGTGLTVDEFRKDSADQLREELKLGFGPA